MKQGVSVGVGWVVGLDTWLGRSVFAAAKICKADFPYTVKTGG